MITDKNERIPTSTGDADHKFNGFGRDWRVRIREIAAQRPDVPANGDPVIAPSAIAYTVSVAALDVNGEVAKDAAGNLLVFKPRVLTIMLGEAGVDVNAAVLAEIEDRITSGDIHLSDGKKLTDSKFIPAPAPPPPKPGPMPFNTG